jgi:hypothetical protein
MATFWWEDGYDPLNPPKQQKKVKNSVKFDGSGESYLLSRLETTGVHRLCVNFMPNDSNVILTLNNTGRRFFSLNHYRVEEPMLAKKRSDSPSSTSSATTTPRPLSACAVAMEASSASPALAGAQEQPQVPSQQAEINNGNNAANNGPWSMQEFRSSPMVANTGYFTISRDGRIMSAAILKCDKMKILDVRNDDLLVNVDGAAKMGYWGQLKFLKPVGNSSPMHDFNNSLLELRVLKLDRSNPTESVLRLWDLGFRNPIDTDPADEVDDDEENVLWSVKYPAGICAYAAATSFIIVTLTKSEKLSLIQWLDRATGAKTMEIKVNDWCSKPSLSKDERFCAFAHIGKCSIRDAVSGEVISELTVPVPFPVVPLGFISGDKFVAMRVDLDMMFILSEWQNSASDPRNCNQRFILNKLGGTISTDSVCISNDEKYLACWPYGCIELFDLRRMTNRLTIKVRTVRRIALILAVHLTKLSRATIDPSSGPFGLACKSLVDTADERIFKMIVGFV